MVTIPEEEDEQTAHEEAEEFIRSVVAGHPQGAVRRIVLYIILALCILTGLVVDGPVGVLAAGFGLVSLLLLSMTDQLA